MRLIIVIYIQTLIPKVHTVTTHLYKHITIPKWPRQKSNVTGKQYNNLLY